MSAVKYRTSDGDTLDLICHHYYGGTSGYVEQVLEANPGLENTAVFEAGVLVLLPELNAPDASEDESSLWD
ncbi:tail protein X [Hydrogenovibrio sp. 3SP14C1]|uniref:tail protein X n=1 Tax=Hydrogenovibrio sp. 3SP14C1 TaxID=3038774 RepID=UPI002415DFF5|nr:tail protein X [Hydrogenovibrio sp. 3SP14C1]MDG4811650.1 tail protein X [Hydrogenovibrio sp. 3SP14C1]